MSQFHPEDASGSQNIVSNQDVVLASDRDQTGAGDIVFKTGGVERARINYAGVGTGWSNVLGGYQPALAGPANLKIAPTEAAALGVERFLPSAPIKRLHTLFAPLACDLAVGLRPNGNDYELLYGFGSNRHWRTLLELQTGNPGSYSLHQISEVAESEPMLSTVGSDATVARGAGVTGPTSNAGAYGGQYWYGVSSGQTFTISVPTSTRIGVRFPAFTNGGLAIVSIDADKTLANLLPTAQNVVDSGAYPNTILVANGGPCNPTDKVLDTYRPITALDNPIAIADGLTSSTHTVVLTPVGVARSVGAGTRVYFSGYGYATASTAVTTASVTTYASANLNTLGGTAWEYAFQTGGTFFGSVHGYEVEDSISVTVDGTVTTFTAGQIVGAESVIEITRTSHLVNPANTAQTVATCTVVYHLDRDGLRVDRSIAWAASLSITAAYLMAALNGVGLNSSGRKSWGDVVFNQGSLLNYPGGATTFTGSADTYYPTSGVKTEAAWIYGGNYALLAWLLDVNEWTNSWAKSTSLTQIEDRGTPAPYVTKIYFGRIWSGSGQSESVASGTTWTGSTLYLMGRFPSGAAASVAA